MPRSLHASEGVVLYSDQPTFDTPVTPATPLGICEFNVTDDGDFRSFFTVGSKNVHKVKAGIAKVDWQIRFSAGTKTHLLRGLRSSGVLPWNTIGFGSDAVDAAPEAWQVSDCKVDQMEISMDRGGTLEASLQGIGRQITTITSLTASAAAAGTEDPLFSYEAVVTLGGVAFECHGFRISVNHNLLMESVLRGASVADAKLRLWDYLTEGNEEISGSVTLARKYSKDMQAKCPANDGNLVISLTEACDATNAWTITVGSVDFTSQARSMPRDGHGNFELPFIGRSIAIA